MGTKAVFAVKGFNQIIGMTSDGSIHNLNYIGHQCLSIAREYKILCKFKKGDPTSIGLVFNVLVKRHSDWLFIDNPKNPQWVSYSAQLQLHPKFQMLHRYDGHFEYFVSKLDITNVKKVTKHENTSV